MSLRTPAPLGISARTGQAAVALLICFFMAWDTRAVSTDQAPLPTDSTLEPVSVLHLGLGLEQRDIALESFGTWFSHEKKGPLTAVIALLFGGLVDDPLVGARLPGVLVHGTTLTLLGTMAARLAGGWSAGVMAVALAGVTPGSFAWHRMDVHDALLSAPLLGILWLLIWPPRRARGAILLGGLVGLAMLLKVGVILFLIAPGAVYILERAGRPGERRRLLLTAATAALVLLPWVIPAASTLAAYVGLSSHDKKGLPFHLRLSHYALFAPLGWAYLAGTPLALFFLHRRSPVSRRFLLMGGLMVGGGTALLLLAFDPMVRYMAPLYPVMALLLAMALHRALLFLARAWRPELSRVAVALACVLLLMPYTAVNLRSAGEATSERMVESGMMAPDQRSYDGLKQVVSFMDRGRSPSLNLNDGVVVGTCPVSSRYTWEQRGFPVRWMTREQSARWLKQGGRAHLLICHDAGEGPEQVKALLEGIMAEDDGEQGASLRKYLMGLEYKVVASATDPNSKKVSLLRFTKEQGPSPSLSESPGKK